MKKHILFILLSVFPLGSIHAEITWNLSDDGTLTISGTDMPEYSYYNVPWHNQIDEIKKVIIEEGVTCIGNFAFNGCSNLASVSIPNSVTRIGYAAFESCSSLTSITIPNSVTSIESYAFYNCINLRKVFNNSSLSLTMRVSTYGYIAYYASVIYNNVSIDGDFRICKDATGNSYVCDYFGSEKNITLPNGRYGIAEYAFYKCSDLTSVTIPNNVTSIGYAAFWGCILQSLTIGTGVKSIASSILGNSKPSKVIWLSDTPPSGYENASGNINYVANENYTKISNTKVYNHLSSMFEVDGIKYVPVSQSEKTCDAIDCNYDETTGNVKIGDMISYKNIGMKVQNINPYTCYGNEFIKTLDINNNGKIDNHAFEGCKNITNVTFGNKVTCIGDYAFYSCTSMIDIKITDLITSVGTYAFSACSALQSVKIGNGSTSIGDYCFNGCSALQTLSVGNGITSVGDFCFCGCKSLQNVVFGDCPATIGTYAFGDCSSLTELYLGKKIRTIGEYAFVNCSSLSKISIPETTSSIGDYAFDGCKSLREFTIEDRKESIVLGSNGSSPLFANCPLDSIYLGGKFSYSKHPFYHNKNLRSVVVADTEEYINGVEFYGCTNLKSVKIGDGVKSIGNGAFSGCVSLENLSFGKSMQSIGQEAFSDCTSMKNIISYAETAPECGSQALGGIDKRSCVLSVPYGSRTSYKNAAQWKEFLFIQELEPDAQTIADKAKADVVIAKIKAIGTVEYTDACKSKIDAASKAYEALTDDQKALVTNLDVLTTAKQTYDNLKAAAEKLAADKAKADPVITKINAIGKVEYTDACKAKIDDASNAYNALTADQKALVSNLDVLTTAEQTYDNLKTAAEKLAADKAKADVVIAKINAIGKVEYTYACKDKIDEANNAYNALTTDQKALVTNLDVLTTAQQTYDNLKAAAEKLAADKAAFDKYKTEIKAIIEALVKEDDSDAVKDIIKKAISDIDALGYEEAISLDDNKVNINSFVTSVNEAVEKQRAEDQKTTGIDELEFAEKVNIYDLNGRKITNSMLKSGLYIRNGKKMVVK